MAEIYNEWIEREFKLPSGGRNESRKPPTRPIADSTKSGQLAQAIARIKPQVVTVQLYDDVGYPWISVSFDQVITPEQALGVCQELSGVYSELYFSRLHPKAVYFLLDDPLKKDEQRLPVSRYGVTVAEIRRAWGVRRSTMARS